MKKLLIASAAIAMLVGGAPAPASAGVHLLLDIFPPPPASPPGLNDGPPVNDRALDVRSERVGKDGQKDRKDDRHQGRKDNDD